VAELGRGDAALILPRLRGGEFVVANSLCPPPGKRTMREPEPETR